MKRMAFFVEGYTEMLFVAKLIQEIAAANSVKIDQKQIRGGSKVPRSITTVSASTASGNESFYVLIFDCGGDQAVKQRILEEHTNLSNLNYEKIIGIRDARPDFTRQEIPQLIQGLRYKIKTSLTPVAFIVPVMEIEAWFLSEHTHYERIDTALTPEHISRQLGFNPQVGDMAQRERPADDLHDIYQLAQKNYTKGSNETIDAIDYTYVYEELRNTIPEIQELIGHIDSFLTTTTPEATALELG